MSDTFSLKILAADKVFYEGPAMSLIIPAMDGSMQILAYHEDMVIATKEGVIIFRENSDIEPKSGIVGIGFVSIESNVVTMVVDSAEWPEEIDVVRAQRALERAQEQLRQDQSIREYNISKASLARAMMRLSAGGRNLPLD